MTLFDVMILLLGATMLAVSAWLASTRPNVIRRSAQSLSSLLLALWLLDCLIGIVIQGSTWYERGGGHDELECFR